MKFMVIINNKYLTKVEAESLCGAEHHILNNYPCLTDLSAVGNGAMAFEVKAGKKLTELEAWAMVNCELVNDGDLTKLETEAKLIPDAVAELVAKQAEMNDIDRRIEELKARKVAIEDEKGEVLHRVCEELGGAGRAIVKEKAHLIMTAQGIKH